jgi:prepilin-type N-terminal cleavage/methylation domain-containing protein/prepilin-type processing-associated H-X9-DG protein
MRIAGSGDRSPLSGVLAPRDEPGLRARRGLTLVEVIVVIAAITLLMALSMPAIQRLRETALRIRCQSQLRQIGIALHHYHIDAGHLPPGRSKVPGPDDMGPDGKLVLHPNWYLSWMVQLLPYLENSELYERSVQACATGRMPWENPPHAGLATVIPLYRCPLDDRLRSPEFDADGALLALTSYLGVSGAFDQGNGLFGGELAGKGARSFAECFDGLSNTVMVGERPPPDSWQAGQWYSGVWHMRGVFGQLRGPDLAMRVRQVAYGADDRCGSGPGGFRFGPGSTMNPCDRYHFWSLHPGGANFLFGDASCRYLRYSADPILSALATCSGGEVVEIPD